MDFTNLFTNQSEVVKMINKSFNNNRLAQLYLFYGEKGTLKMDAAIYFASLVLCEAGGNCGMCSQCKKIERLVNPNIYIVSPDGEVIKKEQVEGLEHEFAMTSDYKRVFIIKDIDKATLAASNSLLKFLESLNDDSYGILLTENINMVLPTIRSRCINLHFTPKSHSVISNELIKRGKDGDLSRAISVLTNNSSEALEMSNDIILDQLINVVKAIGIDIEDMDKNISLSLVENGNILKQIDKKYHYYFLDLLMYIQNDKVKKLLCINDGIIFEDTLEVCTLNLDRYKQVRILEIILSYKEKIKYNINIDLMYSSMMIEIGKVR